MLREPDPSDRQPPEFLAKVPARKGDDLAARSHKIPAPRALVPIARLAATLRRLVTIKTEGTRLDDLKLVRHLAGLRPLVRLPRRPRRAWTARLQAYWDQAKIMGPCWHDQSAAIAWLKRWRGPQGLEVIVVDDEGHARWYPLTKPGQAPVPARPVKPPDSGTMVLALGDLGFAADDRARQALWTGFRERARRAGAHRRALVLCPKSRWQSHEAALWNAVDWERPRGRAAAGGSPPDRATLLEALLLRLSPAIRIETGLLRDVRLFAARDFPGTDLGIELDAWMDSRAVFRNSALGMVLDPAQAQAWRAAFLDFPEPYRKQVAAILARFHGRLARDILAEEELACGS